MTSHRGLLLAFSLILLVTGTGNLCAQSGRPFKDLAFAQVAAGGGYETWITVTNRGVTTYNGTLNFYTGNPGTAWNPKVNGTALSGGKLAVAMQAGATVTMKVTGAQNTEAGFAAFTAADNAQTNFLEGNLTYYVLSGDSVLNSVGVLPATEIFLSSIPFEDFTTLALAFINQDTAGRTAHIQLTVYSDSNTQLGKQSISLERNGHRPTFAYQLFPSLSLKRGRLEIESDVPIGGTALSFVQSQFSSLPLLSTNRVYDILTNSNGLTSRARMSLWSEGLYFKGYLVVSESNGTAITPPDPYLVTGLWSAGKLKLLIYGSGPTFGREVVEYITSDGQFTFSSTTVTGTYLLAFPENRNLYTGTFTMTRAD
jgi:hypothetical protein